MPFSYRTFAGMSRGENVKAKVWYWCHRAGVKGAMLSGIRRLNEGRVRPGRWLGSVLCVSSSASTLLFDTGHLVYKNMYHL